ncbi:unnamed protein product, partial [Rotaria sp. Silwood1]
MGFHSNKSLVQKVTDIRKSEKHKSQKQEQNKQPQQDPISLSEDNHDLVSVATNHQTEICGVCYHSSTYGICSTIDCTHEAMEIPSDDVVEIVSFDLAEQLKILIDKNIDLLQKYQNEARTQTTSDANDVVRGDVYQSILNVHKDFFVSVMIHSDGIPLHKSKNCNAWPILGAVLELPPYSRTCADNTLLLSLWIGKQNLIHDILRRPRSFSNVEKWKVSEVQLFILYIGSPVLAEFLPEERIGDFALYNVILRLLHDYWDNDKKLGDSISNLLKIY